MGLDSQVLYISGSVWVSIYPDDGEDLDSLVKCADIAMNAYKGNVGNDGYSHQKVAEMIRNNVLGFYKIGIYSLKMNQKDYVFIYAACQQEAVQFYTKPFNQTPLNCHEYSLDFQLASGNDVISFRDMRKEFESFPAIAGYFRG
jgi:hypothetical protein